MRASYIVNKAMRASVTLTRNNTYTGKCHESKCNNFIVCGQVGMRTKNTRASTIAPYFQARLEHLVGLHLKSWLLELPANTLAYHEIELRP